MFHALASAATAFLAIRKIPLRIAIVILSLEYLSYVAVSMRLKDSKGANVGKDESEAKGIGMTVADMSFV